jgi:small-conductance mechanosensitive channel
MPPGATRAAWTEAVDERNAGNAAANGVYWLVLLTALMVAVDALGLPVFSKWSGTLASYLPKVVIAVGLVFGGVVAGRVARSAVMRTARRLPPSQARSLARLTQVSIVVALILIAAGQLGVDTSFLTAAFLIVLSATLGGAALAFGLGARDVMADILAMHYVHKSYRPGQVVRVGSDQGRILRITHTGVVLESQDGETAIPGRHFVGERCVLLSQEEERES